MRTRRIRVDDFATDLVWAVTDPVATAGLDDLLPSERLRLERDDAATPLLQAIANARAVRRDVLFARAGDVLWEQVPDPKGSPAVHTAYRRAHALATGRDEVRVLVEAAWALKSLDRRAADDALELAADRVTTLRDADSSVRVQLVRAAFALDDGDPMRAFAAITPYAERATSAGLRYVAAIVVATSVRDDELESFLVHALDRAQSIREHGPVEPGVAKLVEAELRLDGGHVAHATELVDEFLADVDQRRVAQQVMITFGPLDLYAEVGRASEANARLQQLVRVRALPHGLQDPETKAALALGAVYAPMTGLGVRRARAAERGHQR